MIPLARAMVPAWSEDKARMEAVARADERAFVQLYALHQAQVFRVAVGILEDRAQARDAVQETFLKLWQVAPRWQPHARVSTWLYRVVVNECLSWRRGALRRVSLVDRAMGAAVNVDADAHAVEVHHTIERRAARAQLVNALATLSIRDRALVVLHVDQDLSPAEMAPIFGLTDNGTRVALHRALQRLKTCLGENR